MEPHELMFRPRKRTQLGYAVLSLVLMLGGWLVRQDNAVAGSLIIGFFGLCLVVFLVTLLPNASYLRLTPAGFEVRSLFRSGFIEWDDVVDIGVAGDTVVFIFTAGAPGRTLRRVLYALTETEGRLPDAYGQNPRELADVMWLWKIGAFTG